MARYPRNSKVTKALLSADANVRKARRTQYGLGEMVPKTFKAVEELFTKNKDKKKVYKQVENWLKKSKLDSDVLMPSYSDFVQGKNVNVSYKGIDVPLNQLETATYIKDPSVNELIKKLGLDTDVHNEVLTNFMRKK